MAAFLRLYIQCDGCKKEQSVRTNMPGGMLPASPIWEADGYGSVNGWLLPSGPKDKGGNDLSWDQIKCGDCRGDK
jgi:hypothetical protein